MSSLARTAKSVTAMRCENGGGPGRNTGEGLESAANNLRRLAAQPTGSVSALTPGAGEPRARRRSATSYFDLKNSGDG